MRTVSIKTYLALLSMGISVAIVAIVVFIIIPTVEDIDAYNREIVARAEEMENSQKRAADPAKSLQELDQVEVRVREFDNATVEKSKELELIKTFESLAETHHISQTPKLEQVTKDAYRFSFINKGDFADHMAYLRALEQLPFYVAIQKIEWASDRTTGQSAVRFDATIYATAP